jgi:hypothetical protein
VIEQVLEAIRGHAVSHPALITRATARKGLGFRPRNGPGAGVRLEAAPDRLAEVAVLVILISTAWLAVALFALTMFRLAALSDDSRAVALAEWIATSDLAEHRDQPADSSAERLSRANHDLQPGRARAARARAISGMHIE